MGKMNVSARQQYNAISKKDLFILSTANTYSTIPASEVMKEVAWKLNQPIWVIGQSLKMLHRHRTQGFAVHKGYPNASRLQQEIALMPSKVDVCCENPCPKSDYNCKNTFVSQIFCIFVT